MAPSRAEASRASRALFDDLVERFSAYAATPARLVHTHDEHMHVLSVDTASSAALLLPDQAAGWSALDVVHPEDHDRALTQWISVLSSEGATISGTLRLKGADESWRWFDVSHTNLFHETGHVRTELSESSRELAIYRELKENESLLRRLTASLPTGIGLFDGSDRRRFANERLKAVSGVDGDHIDDYLAAVTEIYRPRLRDCVAQIHRDGLDRELEVGLDVGDDTPRHCRISLRLVPGGSTDEDGLLLFVDDITESWHLHEQLSEAASIDPLTGVANRNAVIQSLDEALSGTARRSTAVVFFDVNGFKKINDHHGHATGDALLRDLCKRLQDAAREDDVVGRLGGDELVVVCPDIELSKVPGVADRFAEALNGRRTIAGVEIRVATSSGFAVTTPGTAMAAEQLIAHADLAMYEQKRNGRSRPGAYDPELFVQHRTAMELEERFVTALRDGELEAHVAPIQRVDSGAVVAYELLPHWLDGDTLLGPEDIIPIAQQRGVLDEVSRWLMTALKDMSTSYPTANLHLRIPRAEVQERGWAIRVIRDLLQHEIDPSRLSLHVRQDEMIDAPDSAWSGLAAARECGLRILLSDFDAGTSGLDIITERSVDGVVIGRRLLDHLRRAPTRRLLAATISMCKELGLEVSACDVHGANDFAAIQSLGVALAQGPFLGQVQAVANLEFEPIDDQASALRD